MLRLANDFETHLVSINIRCLQFEDQGLVFVGFEGEVLRYRSIIGRLKINPDAGFLTAEGSVVDSEKNQVFSMIMIVGEVHHHFVLFPNESMLGILSDDEFHLIPIGISVVEGKEKELVLGAIQILGARPGGVIDGFHDEGDFRGFAAQGTIGNPEGEGILAIEVRAWNIGEIRSVSGQGSMSRLGEDFIAEFISIWIGCG